MSPSTTQRRPRWAARVSVVMIRLARSRHALRRAARRAGDRRLSQLLRRLADRKRAVAEDLARNNPPPEGNTPPEDLAPPENVEIIPVWLGEVRAATEIGSLAACVRSNRRLRVAVEYALEARPPDRIRHRLERLRDRTDQESVRLSAQLRDLAIFPTDRIEGTPPGGRSR